MTALADLLDPADRERLAALSRPANMDYLARIAADSARDSAGIGRTAWLAVAVALGTYEDLAEARDALTAVLDGQLRTVALACLGALTSDNETTTEEP